MTTLFSNKYILFLFRLVLGFVFIYAGIEKIADPHGFSTSISNYKLFPLFSINLIAIPLPWFEVVAGVLLIFGIAVKENALMLNVLLFLFIVAIAISLFRGLDIDCGCFGSDSQIGFLKIVENFVLLFFGIILMKFNSTFLSLQNQSSPE